METLKAASILLSVGIILSGAYIAFDATTYRRSQKSDFLALSSTPAPTPRDSSPFGRGGLGSLCFSDSDCAWRIHQTAAIGSALLIIGGWVTILAVGSTGRPNLKATAYIANGAGVLASTVDSAALVWPFH